MTITHSSLFNDFLSFWFDTFVDGEHRFETVIDFHKREWYFCQVGVQPCLFHGRLEGPSETIEEEKASVENVKPIIEAAIRERTASVDTK